MTSLDARRADARAHASAIDLADRAELRAWATRWPVTLSAAKEEAETEDEDPGLEEKSLFFQRGNDALDEAEWRARTLGDLYPFILGEESLRYREETPAASTYLFCLALSVLPSGLIDEAMRSPEFELVALEAARSYFGAEAVYTGAKWHGQGFDTYGDVLRAVRRLAFEVGEPQMENAELGGDGGWDIFAARPFRDAHWPRMIAMGNCATSKTDWTRKGDDKSLRSFWTTRFQFTPSCPTLKFLSVPFVCDDLTRLETVGDDRVFFDRMRLSEWAPEASPAVAGWLAACRPQAADIG